MWQLWLIIAGICLIGEIITVGFLVFWLALGALLAMIVSFFTHSLIIQGTVFLVSSTILIFATKPFVKKFLTNNNEIKTNAFSIIGKVGIVIKEIDTINSVGQIKVGGEIWSATGYEDENIEKGTEIKVLEINGVKAVVKKNDTI